MTSEARPASPEQVLALADCVLDVLERHQIDGHVIGAFVLAVHNYHRATEDAAERRDGLDVRSRRISGMLHP